MTMLMLRQRATAATTTLLRARTSLAGLRMPAYAPLASLTAATSRQVSTSPPSMLRSAISPLRARSPARQSSTLTSSSSNTTTTTPRAPEPDYSTNHSETHYGRIDGQDRAVWFWLAAPFLVIWIPFALSYDHDKELSDLAKGRDKDGGLSESIRKTLKLDEKKEEEEKGPSRTMLNSIWRRRMSKERNDSYKSIMSSSAITRLPQAAQDKISEVLLTANQWYVNQPAGKLAVVPIMALNTGVFFMWVVAKRRPRWEAWMWRNFSNQDLSWRRPWTMFTHAVSHSTGKQFLFSQWAIWTIGGGAVQRWQDHIVDQSKGAGAFKNLPYDVDYSYLVAAVFFSCAILGRLASRTGSKWTMQRLMHKLQTMPHLAHQARRELGEVYARRAMGSTAGIYGLFGCYAVVDQVTAGGASRLEVPFLTADKQPTIGVSFLGASFLELIALALGARRFDHAAHLIGGVCGGLWVYWPSSWWMLGRNTVAEYEKGQEEARMRREMAAREAAAKQEMQDMVKDDEYKQAQLTADAARMNRMQATMQQAKEAAAQVKAATSQLKQAQDQHGPTSEQAIAASERLKEAFKQTKSKLAVFLENLDEREFEEFKKEVGVEFEEMLLELRPPRTLREKVEVQ